MKFSRITVNENLDEAVANIKRVGITTYIAFLGVINDIGTLSDKPWICQIYVIFIALNYELDYIIY